MLRSRLSCLVLVLALACGDDDGPTDAAPPVDATTDVGETLDAGVDAGEDAGEPDTGVDSGPPGPPCAEALDLYADSSCETLQPGVLAYSPRFWLWSDGTDKDRFIRFPEGAVIDTRNPNGWIFPVGTKIWKTFSLDGIRLETRVMEKTASGAGSFNWQFRTYRWSEDQISVTEVVDGETNVLGTGHDIPAQGACIQCHGPVGGGSPDSVLGFGTIQLAHDATETDVDQLADLGLLSPAQSNAQGMVPGPSDTVAALGYLHANCGHCHGPTHFTGFAAWLQPGLTSPVNALAYQTGVRQPTAGWRDPANPEVIPLRIAPGSPESSSVYLRSGIRGAGQMPPLATEVVHTEGQRILDEWIRNGDFPE